MSWSNCVNPDQPTPEDEPDQGLHCYSLPYNLHNFSDSRGAMINQKVYRDILQNPYCDTSCIYISTTVPKFMTVPCNSFTLQE